MNKQFYVKLAEQSHEVYYDPRVRSVEGVQWVVADIEGEQWVIFQGTDPKSLDDWYANFEFGQTEWEGKGMLHLGYYLMAMIALRHIDEKKIAGFAGHSLGGAVAHICGLLTNKEAVSFGAPRWGDPTAAKEATRLNHKRFALRGDKIPYLPPYLCPVRWFMRLPIWWAIYKHGGQTIKLGPRRKPWAWKSIWNHAHKTYVERTKEWAEK